MAPENASPLDVSVEVRRSSRALHESAREARVRSGAVRAATAGTLGRIAERRRVSGAGAPQRAERPRDEG